MYNRWKARIEKPKNVIQKINTRLSFIIKGKTLKNRVDFMRISRF
jgi:hypothetical protein